NHANGRQALIPWQPPSIKDFDDLTGVDRGHPRRRRMSQHTLDLRMFEDLIPSPSRHKMHSSVHELCNHRRVAILAVESDQSHLCWESKVLQVGGDGLERARQFLPIVAIAAACVGADPLARVHLKSSGACTDHLTTLASLVAGRTDRIESTSRAW